MTSNFAKATLDKKAPAVAKAMAGPSLLKLRRAGRYRHKISEEIIGAKRP